ncbi:MAG TPA: CusA/CzcA family heavy metal efflux RND transporter, partial [Polyangiales bacterium]|nr:CusA/CzcA family heavy metal efflux RND transporter [Polyangiales bacterium]
MLGAIVRWSLHNRPLVLVATLLFVLAGARAALSLPIDAVPDVTNIQVQVISSAPALSPIEIEQYVTVPIERALAGLPRTSELRSVSKYGLSVVTVGFHDGTDIYFARQLIDERMREVEDAVPARYGKPEVGPISTGLGEVLQFTVENPRLSLMQLEELLDWEIRPRLRTVSGVIEVNSFGGQDRQYQVLLDPRRLQAAGISVADVARALERSNANAGGGYIEHNREHFVIGTDGLVRDLDDLRRVVIGATPQGVPITIATVGDVHFGPRLRRGAASKDARGEVVVGVTMMLMGENSRTVTEAVKQRIAEITPSLPAGTKVTPFYDRAALVERTITTVGTNLLEGALLVVLVLMVLLGDLRAGLVVATTIPLSLLFAVLMMNAFGLSGNLMSLGAIDFGLIVDGAVIIVENAVRRLNERPSEDRLDTIEQATIEVRAASVFGELTIAIVYLPLLALIGMEGKLFRPMATTVLLALLGAFLLSLTVVPVLTSYAVKPRAHHETWLLRKAHALYEPALKGALKHRVATVSGALAILALSVFAFVHLGAEFVPQLDEGDLLLEVRRLPGVALSESIAEDHRIQLAARAIPEVASVVCKTGAPELATDPMGIEQTDVYLNLRAREDWRPGLSKEALGEEIAEAVQRAVPEVGLSVSQPIEMRTNELVAGIRSDGALLLYGSDLTKLQDYAARAAHTIASV